MSRPASLTRRDSFKILASAALGMPSRITAGRNEKPLRGAFMILATPYTEGKAIDFDDLEREVEFLDRCGVQGMVWPQKRQRPELPLKR